MNRADRAEKQAKIWWKSRADAKVSQEYMALGLGVSKKTISNWEKGLSSPTFFQGTEWFRIINKNPMPYFYEYMVPSTEGISGEDEDEKLDKVLVEIVDTLSIKQKRQLLYMLYGDHGSSPVGILQMITAHLQTPMRDRLRHGALILYDYRIARHMKSITDETHIQPDCDCLEEAISQAREAVINNKNGYSI